MAPEIYEQLFVLSESAKTTAETIEGFAKYPQFKPTDLSQFANSIREIRTRAAAYLTQVVLSEEKADALRMMKDRELPPLVF
jgi:hypothetical protein